MIAKQSKSKIDELKTKIMEIEDKELREEGVMSKLRNSRLTRCVSLQNKTNSLIYNVFK